MNYIIALKDREKDRILELLKRGMAYCDEHWRKYPEMDSIYANVKTQLETTSVPEMLPTIEYFARFHKGMRKGTASLRKGTMIPISDDDLVSFRNRGYITRYFQGEGGGWVDLGSEHIQIVKVTKTYEVL